MPLGNRAEINAILRGLIADLPVQPRDTPLLPVPEKAVQPPVGARVHLIEAEGNIVGRPAEGEGRARYGLPRCGIVADHLDTPGVSQPRCAKLLQRLPEVHRHARGAIIEGSLTNAMRRYQDEDAELALACPFYGRRRVGAENAACDEEHKRAGEPTGGNGWSASHGSASREVRMAL